MDDKSVWKERIELPEEPMPGWWGRRIAEWVGGDNGRVSLSDELPPRREVFSLC